MNTIDKNMKKLSKIKTKYEKIVENMIFSYFKYSIFILDDQILLKIVKINKFNHKYWPIKSYFMISILITVIISFFGKELGPNLGHFLA